MTPQTVLLAILAFEAKHFACDFLLQSGFQARTKRIYGHYGGFIHAGLHALLSLPALFVLSATAAQMVAIAAFEFALHYHVDWAKGQVDTRMGWTEVDAQYWMVFGTDQFVHQLTYIGFVAYLGGML